MLVSLSEQKVRVDAAQSSLSLQSSPFPSSPSTTVAPTVPPQQKPLPISRLSSPIRPAPPPPPVPSDRNDEPPAAADDVLLGDLQRLRLTPASDTAPASATRSAPPPAPPAPRPAESSSPLSPPRSSSSFSPSTSALQALVDAPRTSASPRRPLRDNAAAKRLVMGALGIRPERSTEEKAAEREKRAQHRQQRRRALDELAAATEQRSGDEQQQRSPTAERPAAAPSEPP